MPDDIFSLADRRLAWLDKRQGLLAQNIANADTPHYVAQDLAPFSEKLSVAEAASQPLRTNPMHMAGRSQDIAMLVARPEQKSATGNSVQLDAELVKVANNDASQELVSDLYKKYLGLYRTALGR